MKTGLLSVVATFCVALDALGQGSFALDDSNIPSGLATDAAGNWYSGTFGMEVWDLNGTSIPAGINLSGAPGSGVLGYAAMVAAGFLKEATYANEVANQGTFELGPVSMPNVTPAGATVVVALAAWNSSAPSWGAMLGNANQATRAGVVAFVQPTVPPEAPPLVPPSLAMSQDLVMTAIPEPPGLPLAGLGAMLLFLLCRRQRR
jgi:hypothetical protein